MRAALRAEWGKTWSVRSPGWCLVGAFTLVCVTGWTLANDFLLDVRSGARPAASVMAPVDAVAPALQAGLLVLAAFAMLTVTSEYSTGSMRSTLQAQPRRARVLAAKSAVSAAVAALVAAAAAGLTGLLVVATLQGHTTGRVPVVGVALRAGLLVGLDAVLVVAVATLVRHAAGALAVSFVLLLGLLVLPVRAAQWTPAGAGAAFLSADRSGYPPAVGLAVTAAWAVVLWAAGATALSRRDA